MKITVISHWENIPNEFDLIHQLFEAGLEHFHLRKPSMGIHKQEEFIKNIDREFYPRMVVHCYYTQALKFNMAGIHLPEHEREHWTSYNMMEIGKRHHDRGQTMSTAVHRLRDLENLEECFDYVHVSPVYKSLTKPHYLPKENWIEVVPELKEKKREIIGLGGVQVDNIEKIYNAGFDGIALLGSIWLDADKVVKNFKMIKKKVDECLCVEEVRKS